MSSLCGRGPQHPKQMRSQRRGCLWLHLPHLKVRFSLNTKSYALSGFSVINEWWCYWQQVWEIGDGFKWEHYNLLFQRELNDLSPRRTENGHWTPWHSWAVLQVLVGFWHQKHLRFDFCPFWMYFVCTVLSNSICGPWLTEHHWPTFSV